MAGSSFMRGKSLVTARTNVQSLVDGFVLTRRFGSEFSHGTWWGAAQHGLTLGSLAIPVARLRGRPAVYLAASHTAESAMPWGSCPDVDNAIRWAGGRVYHDQYDLPRQDKIRKHSRHSCDPEVISSSSCGSQPDRTFLGLNCGRCEKCMRTIVGLLASGIDPAMVGMAYTEATFTEARGALESGCWHVIEQERMRWTSIQEAVPGRPVPAPGVR